MLQKIHGKYGVFFNSNSDSAGLNWLTWIKIFGKQMPYRTELSPFCMVFGSNLKRRNIIQMTSFWLNHLIKTTFKVQCFCIVSERIEFHILIKYSHLTFSWQMSISYRNQSIDLQSKSMDCFLYNRDIRHERVKFSFFSC